ncbi:MAG: thermonuclease family protein [Planctomycetes bacterium]|nr:thermonuclease family protein [Planctomycetota bacterium]
MLAGTATPAYAIDWINGSVTKVYDGDTIHVTQGDTVYKIRFYGVDTPEMAQKYGKRARDFTNGLVMGETVTVRVKERDRYGRYVGEVIVGFLNGNMAPIVEFFGLSAQVDYLAVAWRVYFDFGAALGDFRAGVKADGG